MKCRHGISEEDVRLIRAHYDIGPVTTFVQPGGLNNSNAVFDNGSERLFLKKLHKRRPKEWSETRIRSKHAAIAYAIEKGIPTPRLIRSNDGATYVERGEYIYELYEYVSGLGYANGNDQQLRSAARLLASMHGCMQRYVDDNLGSEGEYGNEDEYLEEIKAKAMAEAETNETRSYVAGCVSEVGELFRRSKAVVDDSRFDNVVLHGDYHAGNMVFTNGHVKGVFDYDFIRKGPRLHDICVGLIGFAAPDPGMTNYMRSTKQIVERTIDVRKARTFLEEYDAVAKLCIGELRVVPAFITAIWIQRECWLAHWFNPESHLNLIKDMMSLIDSVAHCSDELIEVL